MVEKVEEDSGKLLRVEGLGGTSAYENKNIRFSFACKVGDIRKQATSFSTCRDHTNDAMRAFVHRKEEDTIYDYKMRPPIDMEKMRLLIARDCDSRKDRYTFKERMFSAKRLLNHYEELGGWEKPSVISTVRLDGGGAKNVWMVTGPKQWVSYAQLMSMVTLIFRVIGDHGPIEFTDNDSVEEWFYNLLTEYKIKKASGVFSYSPDLDIYLENSWNRFHMLVTRYDEIFTQPLKEAFPKIGGFHTEGGINSLCTYQTRNKTLDHNMKRIWKDEEAKRKRRIEGKKTEHDRILKMETVMKTF